jgi:hypothetical protein
MLDAIAVRVALLLLLVPVGFGLAPSALGPEQATRFHPYISAGIS